MDTTYVEDVGLSPVGVGPVVKRQWGVHSFTVDFGTTSHLWFMNTVKIHHDKYKTIGEANRGYLHDLLDEHINSYLRGEITNPYRQET